MACMVCAFVLSFMLTVTALAGDDFDSANEKFIGRYNCTNTINFPEGCYIEARNDGYFQIRIYMDQSSHNYYSGVSTDWKISTSTQEKFYAYYNSVTKVKRDGTVVKPISRVDSFRKWKYIDVFFTIISKIFKKMNHI